MCVYLDCITMLCNLRTCNYDGSNSQCRQRYWFALMNMFDSSQIREFIITSESEYQTNSIQYKANSVHIIICMYSNTTFSDTCAGFV